MPTDIETAAVETEIAYIDPVIETEVTTEAAPVQPDSNSISVSESDYILLCNAVAHEAGANNIPATEKAKVVEVIMNRVASPLYPDTIYGVLTQKYQFSGSSTYVNLGTFSHKVSDLVKESVDLYLSDPSQFSEGYTGFYGDGKRNYFS
jgi:spore germination cell wall hydrolase CwlJ-like protein